MPGREGVLQAKEIRSSLIFCLFPRCIPTLWEKLHPCVTAQDLSVQATKRREAEGDYLFSRLALMTTVIIDTTIKNSTIPFIFLTLIKYYPFLSPSGLRMSQLIPSVHAEPSSWSWSGPLHDSPTLPCDALSPAPPFGQTRRCGGCAACRRYMRNYCDYHRSY
jgi:hypothetical protein